MGGRLGDTHLRREVGGYGYSYLLLPGIVGPVNSHRLNGYLLVDEVALEGVADTEVGEDAGGAFAAGIRPD